MAARVIEQVLLERYPGPFTSFNELHVSKAILLLGERGPIGRAMLSKNLFLGGGAVRTLIHRLKESHLVIVERTGCRLTSRGEVVYRELKMKIPIITEIEGGILATEKFTYTVLVKKATGMVKRGIEQRDAAVRAGGGGATTFIFKKGSFTIPGSSSNCETEFPNDVWRDLSATLNPRDGDVIIVCNASSKEAAEYGALAAAWTIIA